MPIELQIIRAQEFIRLGAHGHIDLNASKEVLALLATACRKRGIHQALLDLRMAIPGVTPIVSPKDLVTLVNTFHEVGFQREDRVAVLYQYDPHRRAKLFSLIATLKGWKVRAFNDFEKAIFWLSAAGPEAASEVESDDSRPRQVPIRKVKQLSAVKKPAVQPVVPIKSLTGSRPVVEPVKTGKIMPSRYSSVG